MATKGARLPDPYYERVLDEKLVNRQKRRCFACGYGYPTVEIPIHHKWTGARADCCPIHTETPGKVIGCISVLQANSGRYSSHGLTRVYSMGGIYRRRQCVVPGCVDKDKPLRWTTAELSSDGVHVRDISACQRCGARTRLVRRLKDA